MDYEPSGRTDNLPQPVRSDHPGHNTYDSTRTIRVKHGVSYWSGTHRVCVNIPLEINSNLQLEMANLSNRQYRLEDEIAEATSDEGTYSDLEARMVAPGEHVDEDLGDDASGSLYASYATPDLVDQHGN